MSFAYFTPSRTGQPWTPHDDLRLRGHCRQGFPVHATAGNLARAVPDVQARIAALGLTIPAALSPPRTWG
jgi:hypothetical protein